MSHFRGAVDVVVVVAVAVAGTAGEGAVERWDASSVHPVHRDKVGGVGLEDRS